MCNHLNDDTVSEYSSLLFLVATQNYSVKIQSEIYALHVHCAVKRISVLSALYSVAHNYMKLWLNKQSVSKQHIDGNTESCAIYAKFADLHILYMILNNV